MDTAKLNSNHKMWQGHLAMFLATVLWGAMSPIAKTILEEGAMGGVALSVLRISGGALLFLIASFLPKEITGDTKVERKDLWMLLLASVLMISLNQGLFIIGIAYTSPIDTTVMCTLTPVFTLIFAAMFIGMPMTPVKVLGVALGLGGALIMAFTDTANEIATNPLLGDGLCMAAQVCAALYYVFFLKIIEKYPPFTIMKWMFLFSLITYVPCMSYSLVETQWSLLSANSYWCLAYIILFPTFIAYLIIPFSQRLLKPTVISMYAYFQPVVAAVIATAMGLAIFGLVRIAATIMIFTGVAFVTMATTQTPKKAKI